MTGNLLTNQSMNSGVESLNDLSLGCRNLNHMNKYWHECWPGGEASTGSQLQCIVSPSDLIWAYYQSRYYIVSAIAVRTYNVLISQDCCTLHMHLPARISLPELVRGLVDIFRAWWNWAAMVMDTALRDSSMRFFGLGLFWESGPIWALIPTLKRSPCFFCIFIQWVIGKFCFTFRVKNAESKNMILSWPQFFFCENHNFIQVQTMHVLFIPIYCV